MVTRPNADDDDDDNDEHDERHARRRLLRLASAVAAVVLIGALAVVLIAKRTTAPERSVEAYCSRVTDVSALSDALASGDGSQIKAATARLRRAAAVAPAEIEPPMQVLVTYADGLETSVATAGHDQGAVDAALADAVRAQQARTSAVESAGQAVQQYTQVTCSIDLTRMTGTSAPKDATTP
jgi:hypothetical protein